MVDVTQIVEQNRLSAQRPCMEEIVPYEEFRKLLEHQKPASRWKNLSFGSATKWVLACALIVIAVFVR